VALDRRVPAQRPQWIVAGCVAPIAGLGGETSAVPLALLMIAGAAVSMIGLVVLARPPSTRQPTSTEPTTVTN